MERLHKNPDLAKTEAMIYDAGYLGDIGKMKIYYIIIEKMKPVSGLDEYSIKYIETVAAFISTMMSRNKDLIKPMKKNIENISEIKNQITTITGMIESAALSHKDIKRYVEYIETHNALNPNWLKYFIEELIVKYLTARTDVHIGNLGITNSGQLRYFDPVYNETEYLTNLKGIPRFFDNGYIGTDQEAKTSTSETE
jgi:hypothetical protein